jgi:filamentous hemagglutinin
MTGYYAAEITKNEKQTKKSTITKNKAQGDAFEKKVKDRISERQDVVGQITVKTESGVKTRLDLAGTDKSTGSIKLTEAKSSATAPLTKNQSQAFPEISQSGATVVGKGKKPFTGGTKIPPTNVDIVRPK